MSKSVKEPADKTALPQAFQDVAQGYLHMPVAPVGAKIGLFGGSFNPPHAGHVLVAELALERLGLDQLWWMVTLGNPLKDVSELAPLSRRIALSEDLISDKRIHVTAFEASYQVRYTADTLALVRQHNPDKHLVWVMGADNLMNFHHWQEWDEIARTYPIAVINRPGSNMAAEDSVMAQQFSAARLPEADAARLATQQAPAWVFIHGPQSELSSTQLREQQAGS
ncbi:nicotinate-nucleotide adenylyltransferase [Pseudochrobactrum asaccharolyticum]|uniref:nicotinate-nucleotide adenylyltransferase n=1 Tax=Pseudochrobactrum asaccharolyticum TaxID=354351 RepID=UPI004041D1B3